MFTKGRFQMERTLGCTPPASLFLLSLPPIRYRSGLIFKPAKRCSSIEPFWPQRKPVPQTDPFWHQVRNSRRCSHLMDAKWTRPETVSFVLCMIIGINNRFGHVNPVADQQLNCQLVRLVRLVRPVLCKEYSRGIEWSLRAFASMRAVRLFLRARTVINFLMLSSEHFKNYKRRARALRKFSASWNLSFIKTFCAK